MKETMMEENPYRAMGEEIAKLANDLSGSSRLPKGAGL